MYNNIVTKLNTYLEGEKMSEGTKRGSKMATGIELQTTRAP
jgi:hypothetical protein